MDGLKDWANDTLGRQPEVQALPPADDSPPIPPGAEAITVADLLAREDLPPGVREWLMMYAESGEEWAHENNPPNWVADEECWEKAKRASEHAGSSDMYAFATWWYIDHAGCAMK